jgi:hypothetical protein
MRALDRSTQQLGNGREGEVLGATGPQFIHEDSEPKDIDDLLSPPRGAAAEHLRQEPRFDVRGPREHVPTCERVVEVPHDRSEGDAVSRSGSQRR